MAEPYSGNVKKVVRKNGLNSSILSEYGKLPPQAVDLEQAVLGALMLERDAISIVIDTLQSDSFYKDEHKEIYGAIRSLFEKSQPIDILTVTNELRSSAKLDFVGGPFYISELTNRVGSAANIEYHARIVAQKYILRRLIEVSSHIQTDAYEETTDVFDLLDSAEKDLFSITEQNLRSSPDNMSTLIAKAITQMEEMRNSEEGLSGVPSGFTALDRITSGWQRSDLIILAARPGMGKCLAKGTKVLMYDGSLKKVEDVRQGDKLMGEDSTPRNVLSIARGRENMYWVRQKYGIDYRVNESHILSLRNSNSAKAEIQNITIREYLEKSPEYKSAHKGYKKEVYFAEQPLETDPYFVGLWLTEEENASQNVASIYMAEPEQNGSILLKASKVNTNQTTEISEKHIAREYLVNSTENRLELLAGILDGAGRYNFVTNGYEITFEEEELASQVKFLADTLGFRTSLSNREAHVDEIGYQSETFRLRIHGDVNRIPVRVPELKAYTCDNKEEYMMTSIKVEFDGEDDYYGFSLDGNRLFLLEDMTVTHNTAFVLGLARNAAVLFKKGVAVFSLEMSSLQLVQRLISAEAEINGMKLKSGDLQDHEWHMLHTKIAKLSQAPIFIDDTPALNVFELRAKCRRLKAQHNIELIIIDYLQLMGGNKDGKSNMNREQEISTISRSLKGLAKELNVPVIALSQLSRAVEQRGGTKKPLLSDLRESGSIEQDADQVLFIYRPEYYGLTEDEEGRPVQGVAEIIIAKNRHGALETVPLRFVDKFAKFTDLDDFSFPAPDDGPGGNFGPDNSLGGGPGGNFKSITMKSKMNDDFDEEVPF